MVPDGELDPLAGLVLIESYADDEVANRIIWPELVDAITMQNWRLESSHRDSRYLTSNFYKGFTEYRVDLEIEHPLGASNRNGAEYEDVLDLSTVKIEIEEVEDGPQRDEILKLFRDDFIADYSQESLNEIDADTQLVSKTIFWYLFDSEGNSKTGHYSEVEIIDGPVVEERWLVHGDSCPDAIEYHKSAPNLDEIEAEDTSEEAQRDKRTHAIFYSADLERFEIAAEAFKVLPGLQKAVQKLRDGLEAQ